MKAWILFRFKHPDKTMGIEGAYTTYDAAIAAVAGDNAENEVIGRVTKDGDRDYHHIRMDTHWPSGIEMQWTGSYYLYEIDITHIVNNPILEA